VPLCDLANDRKSEPASIDAVFDAALKALEDTFALVRRHARPVVLDYQPDQTVLESDEDSDGAALVAAISQRVVEQIFEGLAD
jgi:hypothetical protein